MKYLLKSVLGVDVDAIAAKVLAVKSVERAVKAKQQTEEWERKKGAGGALVLLPGSLRKVGKG
jgi:hypothetical protein